MKSVRFHAFRILNQFYQTKKQLKAIRNHYLARHKLPPQDRNRLLVLTNEVIRWQGRLDYWLGKTLNKPIQKLPTSVHTVLRIGTYELRMDTHIPDYAAINSAVELVKQVKPSFAGVVNSVLRNLSKRTSDEVQTVDQDKLHAQWYSFPAWLLERWEDRFGRELTLDLISWLNQPAPLDVRLNLNQLSPGEFLDRMKADEIQLQPHENSDCFFRILFGGQKVRHHPLLSNGTMTIQDRASGAVVELLDPQPGETILDVCAAPGTKTGYIAERMKKEGRILACDNSPDRLPKHFSDEMGIIRWQLADARTHSYPVADRILVDAPCTGTGVIGRKPDIRWRRTPDMIHEMTELQLDILTNVCQSLVPGGIMIYATCSLEEEENWKVVEAFLKLNKHFIVEDGGKWLPPQWISERGELSTFPPRDKVDGMFAVRLKHVC